MLVPGLFWFFIKLYTSSKQVVSTVVFNIFMEPLTWVSPKANCIIFQKKNRMVSIAIFFLKQSFFSIFSLFLKVGEVCNNSNKCWFPNRSVNKIFLHKTPYKTTQSCAVDRRRFQKGRLFTTFLPNRIENEVCNISNKYRSCKSLRTY